MKRREGYISTSGQPAMRLSEDRQFTSYTACYGVLLDETVPSEHAEGCPGMFQCRGKILHTEMRSPQCFEEHTRRVREMNSK